MRTFYRRIPIIVTLLIWLACPLVGQEVENSVRKARTDLAVPGNPAYSILGGGSSEIMRPGSLREVTVLFGDMLSSNSVVPATTAFEVSPMLLATSPTLSEYSASRWLYSTRLSFATTSDGVDGGRRLSFGIRIALIDNTDLRNSKELLEAFRAIGDQTNDLQSQCLSEHLEWASLEDNEREKLIEECVSEKMEIEMNSAIKKAREFVKQKAWNNAILELGAAGAARSSDSLVANISSSAYSFYATWAQPVFGPHGQVLLAIRASSLRGADDTFGRSEAATALRCYLGTNSFKGFLEVDFLARSDMTPLSSGSLGIELNLYNGIWIDGSAGLEKAGSDPARINGGFNLRLATPEVVL
jgi:hypothetical protein